MDARVDPRLPPELLGILSTGEPPAFASDSRNRVVFWNEGAARLLGRRADQAVGRHCFEVLQGRDVFGNRFCQANCTVASMAREGERARPFEMSAPCNGSGRQPLGVTTLLVPGPRPDLFLLVHLLDLVDPASVLARLRPLLPPCTPHPGGLPPTPPPLTDREREILTLAARGLQNKEIARQLGLSLATVRNHVHNTLEKLGVHSKLEAVSMAYRLGWVEGQPEGRG